jgi:hypothetical protein
MPQQWTTFFTMPVGRVAVVALLLALAGGETAYGQDFERESLRGIGPVRVVIEVLNEDATGIGLSEAGLKASVELQLRRNGVPLEENILNPYLYVNVGVAGRNPPIVASVDVSLLQAAVLNANEQIHVVSTWREGATASRSFVDSARDIIRARISEFVDIFSNDYLTVNPQP